MLSLAEVGRASITTRFNNVATSRDSTVADHSYMCAMIARRLIEKVLPDASSEERLALIEYCLIHDVEEVVTCDMNGPFKHFLCDKVPGLKDVLDDVGKTLNPESFTFKEKYASSPLLVIAKLADQFDSFYWFSRYGHTDQEYENVLFQVNEDIETCLDSASRKFPAIQWGEAKKVFTELTKPSRTFDIIERHL